MDMDMHAIDKGVDKYNSREVDEERRFTFNMLGRGT